MMTSKTTNNVIVSLYSDDLRLMAQVSEEEGRLYVDFYKDDVLIDSREVIGHSVQYAHDMAENYATGILRVDPKTWRVNGI
jgi:hypothetical protein